MRCRHGGGGRGGRVEGEEEVAEEGEEEVVEGKEGGWRCVGEFVVKKKREERMPVDGIPIFSRIH